MLSRLHEVSDNKLHWEVEVRTEVTRKGVRDVIRRSKGPFPITKGGVAERSCRYSVFLERERTERRANKGSWERMKEW